MKEPIWTLARCTVLLSSACILLSEHAAAFETLQLEVREAAGIRRFGYPIALALPEETSASADTHFRLRDGGKLVPAQFRQGHTNGGASIWWLDFNISLLPHEVRFLTLDFGPDIAAAAEPQGLELKRLPDGFEIRNGTELTWILGDSLRPLLKSVDAGGLQHVRPQGLGLSVEAPNGVHHDLGEETVASRVVRSGPLAIAIRYELAPKAGPLAGATSTIDLTFPVSKSWVQVDWQIDDPHGKVRSARAKVAQNLNAPTDKEPTLIDFGASSLVYLSLAPGTLGKLRASQGNSNAAPPRSWEVLRGPANAPEPFVVEPSGAEGGSAEGWAHVMDRSRCLALAIGAFGEEGEDSIEVAAAGDVNIARKFKTDGASPPTKRSLQFWLHFVGFPPHVTAATSPQSMLSPLVVRINKP
ncbi:MAG TPA: hypothetical protein VG826_17625 [Pirellulales bacterium]|nr:hypothetical protein [Pirellulales bacterium]